MLTLHKLNSKGIQETISSLEGAKKQSADAYSIGSTVQPVVNVNNGVVKNMSITNTAGNVVTNFTVPVGKIWKLIWLYWYLDTDANVADRTQYLYHAINGFTNAINLISLGVTAANGVNAMELGDIPFDGACGAAYISSVANEKFYAGDSIRFVVNNGVAGDIYTIEMRVLEFDVC